MDHLNLRSDATGAGSTCTGDSTMTARADAVQGDVGQPNFYGVAPGAPKSDYISLEGLRDRLLAPREIVRDKDGYLVHPEYPLCDEGTRPDKFLEAFGIESSFVGMEHDASEALYAEYLKGFDVNAWTPTPPAGDGWLLLELYDTENGPCALFARRKVEAPRNRRRGAPSEAPVQRPTDDALWDQTLQERDRYHEWADKLADAIAQHVDIDIGEHSSGNNPWAAALAALESIPTASATDAQADHIGDERNMVAAAAPQFLFIAMDDDGRAHLTWCEDGATVRAAVQAVMFTTEEVLHPEHAEEVAGVTEDLLDCGGHVFEGDPPIFLYRLPASSAGDQEVDRG